MQNYAALMFTPALAERDGKIASLTQRLHALGDTP